VNAHTLATMSREPSPVKPGLPPPDATKAQWRRWARLERVQAAIVARVRGLLDELAPTTVVAFAAMGDEIDVGPIVAGDRRHRWALTRTPASGPLTLHRWDAPRERHTFGFSQPVAGAPTVAVNEVGAVLVPGLVFDETGTRIGHGRGYYDMMLATCPPSALTIGVAADALVVPGPLPREAHDVVMAVVVTELRTITRHAL
jgi:5-formyltetrahydrofolate cyclo-ligase